MVKILPAQDIDPLEWDRFIDSSKQANIYAQYWYLSTLTPGWYAVHFLKNDRLIAVMPYITERKFFQSYINTPFAIQQLGLYTQDETLPDIEDIRQILAQWLKQYAFVSYRFNIANTLQLEPALAKLPVRKQITHLLSLNESYNILYENFSANHKRNIRKAYKNGITTQEDNDLDTLIELFKRSREGLSGIYNTLQYIHLKDLYRSGRHRNACRIYTARNPEGNIIAGGFFLFYKQSIVYVFGASADEGRQTGAMAAVFDHLIRDHACKNLTLDFEGSLVPSLARFYRGFGGKAHSFLHLFNDKRKYILKIKQLLSHVHSRQ